MIGQTISHYRVERKIGEGGMGEVYLATDTKLGRQVALKFIPPALSKDADARDRLLREAQAASRLAHPNIMTVHSIEREGDRDFIVMEYVEGMALNDYCKAGNKSVADVLDLAIQLAAGIDKAHAAGVIHRDLKPANILVDADGRARILDFGLAKMEDAAKLTKTGSTIGTMAYFSPEQAQGRDVDRRSDLFSFGVVLYEALAQRLPFNGEHQAAVVYCIVHEQPQPVARFNNAVSPELERLVVKCLAKSPDERYQSAADLLADLRRIKSEFAPTCRPISPEKSRPMLAVLPFANLGPAEDEYFADGMTEEIISRMAGVEGLGVISRTSAMRYKKTDKSIREIGSELGAEYILEGTVRWGRSKDGPSRVRITPQLIRVSDDTHLWSDRYDRMLEDVFDVQSDIAQQVFDNLNVSLLGNERAAVTERPTESAEAYDAYLQGLAYHRRHGYTLANFEKAVQRLEEAIRHDPRFALAHAQLALVHTDIYFHGHDFTQKRLQMAKASLDKAMEFGPELVSTHMALGLYYYRGFLDYAKAEKELRWAFEKNPEDEDIRLYFGAVRRRQGHWQEFLDLCLESLARNPRDPGLPQEIGLTYSMLRRYDEAQKYFDLALSIEPDVALVRMFSAWCDIHASCDVARARERVRVDMKNPEYEYKRFLCLLEIYDRNWDAALDVAKTMPPGLSYEQAFVFSRAQLEGIILRAMGRTEDAQKAFTTALADLEAGLAGHHGDARFHSALGIVHAYLGHRELALREAEKGVELYPTSRDLVNGPMRELECSIALALTGEADRAIDLLEVVFSRPSWFSVNMLKLDPVFDPLRDHPRYKALLAKDYPPF